MRCRFSSSMDLVFVAILIFACSFLSIAMEANAFEQSSDLTSPRAPVMQFLVYLLENHSDLIHMQVATINSSEPQCVVIVENTKDLEALPDFQAQYRYFSQMKHRLNFQFFSTFDFKARAFRRLGRPVIFTHELIKHKLRECNSAAFEDRSHLIGQPILWSDGVFFQERLQHQINEEDVYVFNRNTGNAEPFNLRQKYRSSLKSNLEQFMPRAPVNQFLVYLLENHSDLVHMQVAMINSSEPQCVVIVENTKDLNALPDFKARYRHFSKMKNRLKFHHFSLFELKSRELRELGRPVIFTHELIKHKLRECNSAAFEDRHHLPGQPVLWNDAGYFPERFEHQINEGDVFVINRNTGNAEPFNLRQKYRSSLKSNLLSTTAALNQTSNAKPFKQVVFGRRNRKNSKSSRAEESSSTAVSANGGKRAKIGDFDLNTLPFEWDFSWVAR